MGIEEIVGWIAFLITVTYTCIGLPIQIRKNYLTKSMSGLSLFMMIILFFTFVSWVIYGAVKSPLDWFIIGSNIPGVICLSAILYQFWVYRPRKKVI